MRYIIRHFRHYFSSERNGRKDDALWLMSDALVALVTIIGAVSLTGYITGREWMHDGWFPGSVDMSPQTAFCFIALGVADLLVHRTNPCEDST